MPDVKEEALKFVGAIGPMLGAGIQLGTGLLKNLQRIGKAQREIGSPGYWFFLIARLPLIVANWILSIVILLALLALFGGINRYYAWDTSRFSHFCETLFNYSLWLSLGYFILALLVYFRVLPRALRLLARGCAWIRPEMKHDPGLINSDWELRNADDAHFVNVASTGCEVTASFLLQIPRDKWGTDFAGSCCSNPSWTVGSRANALLIGCCIEGIVHGLPEGNPCKTIPFSILYKALEDAGERIWQSQNILNQNASANILNSLRVANGDLACLADEPAVVGVVKATTQRLRDKFQGDGSKLARAKLSGRVSLRLARKRLRKFPKMAEADSNPMDAQFLKLAYSANVWNFDDGRFIFPFSRGVALLMMNSGCLITTQDVDTIAIDNSMRWLTAFAEQKIVDFVTTLLKNDPHLITKSGLPNTQDIWEINRMIDYRLWWLSRQPNGWKLYLAALDEVATEEDGAAWKLSGNTFVRSG